MFDYIQLEEEIKKMIELAEKLPEKYQVKCFEVMLTSAIAPNVSINTAANTPTSQTPQSQTTLVADKIDIPIDVQSFLMQYSIPEDSIDKLFLKRGAEIRLKRRVTTDKVATAQVQLALLAGLENALIAPETKFEFSHEKVRALCKQQNKYDASNFKAYFKKNKKYFLSLADEDHVGLSPDGKDELANLVADLVK